MRSLYFSETFTVHDHRFLSSLAKTEHEVFFVRLLKDERDMSSIEGFRNIRIDQSLGLTPNQGFFDLLREIGAFNKIVQRIQPDLVHAGPLQNCAFIAAMASPTPLLAMSWGFDLMDIVHRRWIWTQTAKLALRRATYYTSDALATQEAAFAFGAKREYASLIPWGVDCEHFSPGPTPAPNKNTDEFVLFCNRSWEPTYGVDVLAKAFALASMHEPKLRLFLLGNGSMGASINTILEDNGVMDKVIFPGRIPQEDLPDYYRRSNLYISASHVDGSSVSLMESLACGLPVLVSDIPGNVPWVEEGKNGWTFSDGNIDMLADKILYAANHREILPSMGKAARQTALEKANWKNNFEALLRTYENTIKASRREI